MKCQKCAKIATLHITEILSDDHVEELHLCEECAHQYLYEPKTPTSDEWPGAVGSGADELDEDNSDVLQQACPVCGLKFIEFRNAGRLGCAHDYEVFGPDLIPLLENIHGEARHVGKVPRRLPQQRQRQSDLADLRKRLQEAIEAEMYEEAASIRDRIQELEVDV